MSSDKLKQHYLDKTWRRGRKPIPSICPICKVIVESKNALERHKISEHGKIRYSNSLDWRKDPEKLKKAIEKQKETYQRKLKSGEIVPPWKGKSLPKSTREKISKSIVKRIIESESCGRRPDVKWYKVKNKKDVEFSVQGTWEKDFANWMNSQNIYWIKNKTVSYVSSDGVNKIYIPDFYLPNTNEYVEVKGLFSDDDREKMNAVIECNPDIRIFFIFGRKLLRNIVNNNIKIDDDLLYHKI